MSGSVGRRRLTDRGRLAAACLAGVAVMSVAGCSSSGGAGDDTSSGSSAASEGGPPAADAVTDGGAADFSAREPNNGEIGSGAGRTDVQTRSVIATGQVQLEADDLSTVRAEIDRLLGRYGGFIAKEETRNDDEGHAASSTLQLRVPSQHFREVMDAFAEFSTVVHSSSKEDDVTTEVIDVDSRVRTMEISLSRLHKFLNRSERVDDMIRIESEIAQREADLASLRSQQNYLADQTSLGTITVEMSLPAEVIKDDKDPLADAGFLTGLRNGWNALIDVAIVAATAVGALLPFALVAGLLLVPFIAWMRTRNRRRAAPPAPAAPPPAA